MEILLGKLSPAANELENYPVLDGNGVDGRGGQL